jgi:agmatine deiminase
MVTRFLLCAVLAATSAFVAAGPVFGQLATPDRHYVAPGEFEPQEYIWLSWVEQAWLGGALFTDVTLDVMRAITPHVRVRLMYSAFTSEDASMFREPFIHSPAAAEDILRKRLQSEGVDLSRVELFYYPLPVGAIQDPGPYFLRSVDDRLALADYGFDHPDPRMEAIDREIAAKLALPTVRSSIASEGGARQVNGRGTLLLVEAVELARNPDKSRDEIEREHRRVHGATNVIWLKQGPADEEWGKLPDGRWGIGTGGHVDVFARFADARTILLAQVGEDEKNSSPILRETHDRMEENYRILSAATDEVGRPLRILRVPVPDTMTATTTYDALSTEERWWFEGAKPGDAIEYYLPGGYLNFIIANGVVVTARFWREGMPLSQFAKDRQALKVLEQAFPDRQVVQIDVMPLLHEGGGLHCYSRNQPFASPAERAER